MYENEGIKREALSDIIKDLKVISKACDPLGTGTNCDNCTNQKICDIIFKISTPKGILADLKKKGII